MMLAVPSETHSAERAAAFLDPYEPELNAVVEILVDRVIIKPQTKEGRVIPGRNYLFTKKSVLSFSFT